MRVAPLADRGGGGGVPALPNDPRETGGVDGDGDDGTEP